MDADAARLWLGVVVPPLVVLFSQGIAFSLVPWACATGHTTVLHLVPIGGLVVVVVLALIASAEVRPAAADTSGPVERAADRARFMAIMGFWLSLFSALVIVALWIPSFILNPCYK
jgi:hypothetical protein